MCRSEQHVILPPCRSDRLSSDVARRLMLRNVCQSVCDSNGLVELLLRNVSVHLPATRVDSSICCFATCVCLPACDSSRLRSESPQSNCRIQNQPPERPQSQRRAAASIDVVSSSSSQTAPRLRSESPKSALTMTTGVCGARRARNRHLV